MAITRRHALAALVITSWSMAAIAQTPPAKPAPRPVLSVATTEWAGGAEIPMKHAFRGENKSPAFEFHWYLGPNPAPAPPDNLKS